MAEAANYVLAFLALLMLGVVWSVRLRNEKPVELLPAHELKFKGVALASATDKEEVEA